MSSIIRNTGKLIADYGSQEYHYNYQTAHNYQSAPAPMPALLAPNACAPAQLESAPMLQQQQHLYGKDWGFAPPPGLGRQSEGPTGPQSATPVPTTIVVVNSPQSAVQVPVHLTENSVVLQCHNCHRVVTSRTGTSARADPRFQMPLHPCRDSCLSKNH